MVGGNLLSRWGKGRPCGIRPFVGELIADKLLRPQCQALTVRYFSECCSSLSSLTSICGDVTAAFPSSGATVRSTAPAAELANLVKASEVGQESPGLIFFSAVVTATSAALFITSAIPTHPTCPPFCLFFLPIYPKSPNNGLCHSSQQLCSEGLIARPRLQWRRFQRLSLLLREGPGEQHRRDAST